MTLNITLNTTWDEIESECRSHADGVIREIVMKACEEIDDLEAVVEEFQDVIDHSQWGSLEDVINELGTLKFEHDFRKLFQL